MPRRHFFFLCWSFVHTISNHVPKTKQNAIALRCPHVNIRLHIPRASLPGSSSLRDDHILGTGAPLICFITQCSTFGMGRRFPILPRKEVIQPQLPLRLPCYDFVPITSPTLGSCALKVRPPTSGVTGFHDVTGGVYKAREHIHRSTADLRLLATPPSRGRVAAHDPN